MHFTEKRLWFVLAAVVGVGFLLLGFGGAEIYRQAPPLPERVVTESGRELMTRERILDGQQVWQGIGGQQIGSIWGHGAYLAPDWSADWLHREAVMILDAWAAEEGDATFAATAAERAAALRVRLRTVMRDGATKRSVTPRSSAAGS